MDFFGQQERARASTRRLVGRFVLAVVLTNLVIYLALAGVFRFTHLFASIGGRAVANRVWFISLANHFATDGFWNWELPGWSRGAAVRRAARQCEPASQRRVSLASVNLQVTTSASTLVRGSANIGLCRLVN